MVSVGLRQVGILAPDAIIMGATKAGLYNSILFLILTLGWVI